MSYRALQRTSPALSGASASTSAAHRRGLGLGPSKLCAHTRMQLHRLPQNASTTGSVYFLDTMDEEDEGRLGNWALLTKLPSALTAVDGPLALPALPAAPEAAAMLPPAPAIAALPAPAPTVLELIQATHSFKRFNQLIHERPFLKEDWLSFINRPWVCGVVTALLSHREGSIMMENDPDLARSVRGIIDSVDMALLEDDLQWMVDTLDHIDRHPAIYTIMDTMEALVDADTIAWLDSVSLEALTAGRLAATADVFAAILTPSAVRRRRTKRRGTPDSEHVAGSSRGGRWGIEAHVKKWKEGRRCGSPGGSPGGSPFSTYDVTLPPSNGPTPACSMMSMDQLPPCSVAQLVSALRWFWTEERIDSYLDMLDRVLLDSMPKLQAFFEQLSVIPGTRAAMLAALNTLERAVPAQRVAEVGAALVEAINPDKVRYGGRAADAVLPPDRLEMYAGVIGEALTDERLEAVPSVLPRLSALLPSEAALSSAVDRLAALVRSPAASQWEAALEAELPPDRLRAWCQGFDSTVTPQRLGLIMDALEVLTRTDRNLALRLVNTLPAPGPAEVAAHSNGSGNGHGDEVCVFPEPIPRANLSVVLSLVDDGLNGEVLGALAGLGDHLLQPERFEEIAAALDRMLPPLEEASCSTPADLSSSASSLSASSSSAAAEAGPPRHMRDLMWEAARRGVVSRSVKALAAALKEPSGAAAAVRIADAAVAPGEVWGRRLAAVPAALHLTWSFHVKLLSVAS